MSRALLLFLFVSSTVRAHCALTIVELWQAAGLASAAPEAASAVYRRFLASMEYNRSDGRTAVLDDGGTLRTWPSSVGQTGAFVTADTMIEGLALPATHRTSGLLVNDDATHAIRTLVPGMSDVVNSILDSVAHHHRSPTPWNNRIRYLLVDVAHDGGNRLVLLTELRPPHVVNLAWWTFRGTVP